MPIDFASFLYSIHSVAGTGFAASSTVTITFNGCFNRN